MKVYEGRVTGFLREPQADMQQTKERKHCMRNDRKHEKKSLKVKQKEDKHAGRGNEKQHEDEKNQSGSAREKKKMDAYGGGNEEH